MPSLGKSIPTKLYEGLITPTRCPPEKPRPPCTAMTYANLESELTASYSAGHEGNSLAVPDHLQDDF